MRSRTSLVLSATLLMFTLTPVGAQDRPLSTIIPNAIFNGVEISAGAGTPGSPHTAHFDVFNTQLFGDPSTQTAAIYESQIGLGTQLNRQIGSQLSTLPIGASTGGFTFTLDPALGTFSRGSDSFGPLFTQRAFTVGRNKFGVGMNYLRRTYDTYEGLNLRDAEIKLFFPHNDCCPQQTDTGIPGGDDSTLNPFFEGDVMEVGIGLNLDTSTFAFFGNYGVTDRFDIGVALPIVNVDLKSELQLRILRLSTGSNALIHSFDGRGLDNDTVLDAGSATGIGDLAIRGKVRFLDKPGGGLAVAADLRLPTGQEEDLLGTGATQFSAWFIGSGLFGKFAPHVNLGYTVASGISEEAEANYVAAPPDEFDYRFGADIAVTTRMTVAADFIGRLLIDVDRLVSSDLTVSFITEPGGAPQTRTLPAYALDPANLNLMLGSAGLKFNITKTLVLSASVLFALNDSGLRDAITPVIGFDYTFAR